METFTLKMKNWENIEKRLREIEEMDKFRLGVIGLLNAYLILNGMKDGVIIIENEKEK